MIHQYLLLSLCFLAFVPFLTSCGNAEKKFSSLNKYENHDILGLITKRLNWDKIPPVHSSKDHGKVFQTQNIPNNFYCNRLTLL